MNWKQLLWIIPLTFLIAVIIGDRIGLGNNRCADLDMRMMSIQNQINGCGELYKAFQQTTNDNLYAISDYCKRNNILPGCACCGELCQGKDCDWDKRYQINSSNCIRK